MLSHPRSLLLLIALCLQTISVGASLEAQETNPFELLRNKDLDRAMETLGEIHDAGLYWSQDRGDGIPALVGGAARLLMQQDESVQYDRLYQWTMPTETRKTVRVLTSPVPHDAPPEIFARVLRERPRETSFEVSSMGGIRGLFCSGWKLVTLAEQLGRLDRLTNELEELSKQGIPDADVLLLLSKLAHLRPNIEFIQAHLPKVVERVAQTSPADLTADKVLHPSVLALGAAALHHKELAPIGEEILRNFRDKANWLKAYRLRGFAHGAHAVAVQRVHGSGDADFLYENPFKFWVPATMDLSHTSAEGASHPIWLAHEDHLLHLTGGYNDILLFRYPLQGNFEFAVEVQSTAPHTSNASFGFGGLFFQSMQVGRETTVWDTDLVTVAKKPCPFAREQTRASFNRVAVQSSESGIQYEVNRHPMWTVGKEATASPFIGFRYYGNHRSLIRNFELMGTPVIPREVILSSGTQLRGWQSRFFGESKYSADPNSGTTTLYDWSLNDGDILARKDETKTVRQSLLRYQRPILEDERIRYEFYYTPGETEVHPALGRMAFLIEPGGVRIHWITDGERDWTGLPEDNATLEPLNRRGPRPLPLKEKDWNAVELSRSENKITLTLNGKTIYERPLDFAGATNFGLFRDPSKAAVRVRNVILTGDWPETIPEEFLKNPTKLDDNEKRDKTRRSLHRLVEPDLRATNVNAIRRRAASLPREERYKFLADWVLPTDSHSDVRMRGEFTQTDPSPLALKLEPYRFADPQGAELVSPVFDLLNTAVDLGRIEELAKQIDEIPDSSGLEQQRSKLALKVLIALERKDREIALELVDQLQRWMHESFRVKANEYWPELHLITRAMRHHAAGQVVAGLITDLYEQRFALRMRNADPKHVAFLMREYQAQLHGLSAPRDTPLAGLKNWIPVTRAIAKSRGGGSPNPRWTFDNEGRLTIGSGHDDDYLFCRSPLAGDYEVHAKMSKYGSSSILTGGWYAGSGGTGRKTLIGTYRRHVETMEGAYPFLRNDKSVFYRAAVEKGGVRGLLNGQQIFKHEPEDALDPWVALRGISYSNTAFYHVQISGNPTIPDKIPMTTDDDLSCWIPYYLGTKEFTWRQIEEENGHGRIYSGSRPDLAGSHFESLLRYHRPLVEDGSVEYEFLYSPGKATAHPALDRLVFLINPDGVKIHWLTDEKYDFTAVPPDNAINEPQNRRGPESLPLKPGEWNRAKLSITGDTASLELNGVLVYERKLEATNQRTFGLFHYADRSELLVRNPVMRGDWPKTLPPAHEQELSDKALHDVERNLAKLTKVFHHDFAKDGLPSEYFKYSKTDFRRRVSREPGGVRVTVEGDANWRIMPIETGFSVQGDFDIQAHLSELDVSETGNAAAFIEVRLDDEQKHYVRTMRRWREEQGNNVGSQISIFHENGRRSLSGQAEAEASKRGTLRISRIGKRIVYLFAQEDSHVFRVLHEQVISDADAVPAGISLTTSRRNGHVGALWKDFTIRAERIKYLPPADDAELKQLWVMNADGTNVRKLTGLLPEMTNLGSPEFSQDGKQIALDMSQGSVASSHVIVMNADGTNIRDLGPGCMPSFSPDGKKIAFTQSRSGVMLMDVDGTNREVIDQLGWSIQFSPNGKYLAYGKGGNIVVKELKTKKSRELLTGADAARYSYTYWNLSWSHDSKSVVFKGRLGQGAGDEVALVEIAEGSRTVLDPDADKVNPDFTFSRDSQSVLFSKNVPGKGARLHLVSRNTPGKLESLEGQPEDRSLQNCNWSRDGRFIAFTGKLDPQPIDWEPPKS